MSKIDLHQVASTFKDITLPGRQKKVSDSRLKVVKILYHLHILEGHSFLFLTQHWSLADQWS